MRIDASGVEELIDRLDGAVRAGDVRAITSRVKHELEDFVHASKLNLPARFHETRAESYARRLLYRDPSLAYTAVVMTWAPGQRTALHDHSGMWCVETVIDGTMEVTQYDVIDQHGDTYRFEEQGRVRAAVGSAGCLIPPFEYHVLANARDDRLAITLHVYGGEMTRCHAFEPQADGTYTRRERTLVYND